MTEKQGLRIHGYTQKRVTTTNLQIKSKQESVEVTNLFSKSWQNNVDVIANSSQLNSPCKTHVVYSVTYNRKLYLAFLCSFAWTWTNILGASTNSSGASANFVLKLKIQH